MSNKPVPVFNHHSNVSVGRHTWKRFNSEHIRLCGDMPQMSAHIVRGNQYQLSSETTISSLSGNVEKWILANHRYNCNVIFRNAWTFNKRIR